jgi:hypothetical protein
MFIIVYIAVWFIVAIIACLFAIWFAYLAYSIWFMRESLMIAECEINALNMRLFKKERESKQRIHDAEDFKVRIDEFEKRLNIIAKTNHSKLEKIERNCNALASKFELFSQSTRKSIADLSKPGKAALSPDSNKIAELESVTNTICSGLRYQIAQMKKQVVTKTDILILTENLETFRSLLRTEALERQHLTNNTYCIFQNVLRTMYIDPADALDYSNHMFRLNQRFYGENTDANLAQ